MQAITVAIGKSGINFFAQQFVGNELIKLLSQLTPPNKTVTVPNFGWVESPGSTWGYSNITIGLSNGSLQGFTPTFQSIQQGVINSPPVPAFTLTLTAQSFSAIYGWSENYQWGHRWTTWMGRIPEQHHDSGSSTTPLTYGPSFGSFTATVVVQFLFDSNNNSWEITVQNVSAQAANPSANISKDSILQHQDNSCFDSHVDDATAAAIDAIDFATPINQLIAGVIQTIPGSGNLGNGIIYDFSLGDSGLQFPNNDGIQMGVKGGASYNGTAFSGDKQPSLPLPVPPADSDTHHLYMYVSNYEVDALNWAYFEAGKLNLLIKPEDLPDAQLLKVSTYVSYEPTLKPYSAFVMYAQITQITAPTTSFQTVYLFSAAVMTLLQSQLPVNIYQLIQGIAGNAYLNQADVETFLTEATVPNQYFSPIETAAKIAAMALTQDITYTLTIQNNSVQQPTITFSVKRTDVLTNLGLGISSNNAQTLQFGFANAENIVTYGSSTIPGFNGPIFEAIVWVIAEDLYAQNMAALGKTGVPLPIMQDFQFDFSSAELSIQNGFVSILANVIYKN